LTSLLFPGIRPFTFALLPWLKTPAGVARYLVEAVQVRGVNLSEYRKAEAMSVGGTYLENLATDHRAVTV